MARFSRSNAMKTSRIAVSIVLFLTTCTTPAVWAQISQQSLGTSSDVAKIVVVDDSASPLESSSVVFVIFTLEGEQIWSNRFPTDSDGTVAISSDMFPTDLFPVKGLYPGTISAQARNHIAGSVNVTIATSTDGVRISPRSVVIQLKPYNPWLTVIVLLPALIGCILAVRQLTRRARDRTASFWYAIQIVSVWMLVVVSLSLIYTFLGDSLIPLFWPGLFVSSGVIIFAFLGSVVYIAFSVRRREPEFFEQDTDPVVRRSMLLSFGGRLLVSPYVALVAVVLLGTTFDQLESGPFALFFAFFTGLWIRVVLDVLNDVGMRFLSTERRQEMADRLAGKVAPSVAKLPGDDTSKPDKGFFDAVATARQALLAKRGVIGVDFGEKVTGGGSTGIDSIVAYVYEKRDPDNEQDQVPPTFQGFPVDVKEIPPIDPKTECDEVMPMLAWSKIHRDMSGSGSLAAASSLEVLREDSDKRILVLVDADGTLFENQNLPRDRLFDVEGAFRAIEPELAHDTDFVSFFIDLGSGFPAIGHYHVPVRADARGTNYTRVGNPGAAIDHEAWSGVSVMACQVHQLENEKDPDLRKLLHEIGHSWSAYATFGASDSKDLLHSDKGQGRFHWGRSFFAENSCMTQFSNQWLRSGQSLTRVLPADSEFVYAPIDLYLMGLLPAKKLPPLQLLRDITEVTSGKFDADIEEVSIADVQESCGERVPAFDSSKIPARFRQRFVLVVRDRVNADALVQRLSMVREKHQLNFSKATGNRAELVTE